MLEWRKVTLQEINGAWYLIDDENGLARNFDTIDDAMNWFSNLIIEILSEHEKDVFEPSGWMQ